MSLSRVAAAFGLMTAMSFGSSAFAADTYNLDPAHSNAIFRIKHLNSSWFYGRFDDVQGTLVLDDADMSKWSINITVKTDSVDTHNEKRDTHLKSPDFFNAAQYPTMTFKSKTIAVKSAGVWTVTGDLTMHGTTKTVTVDLERVGTGKDPWGGTRTGAETTFTLKRSEYGVSGLPDGLGDEVRVIVSVEAIKK